MKDDKFCVSKTVAFLVSLIVIVGGIFYVMNYANQQKVSKNTEAALSFKVASKDCVNSSSKEKGYCVPTPLSSGAALTKFIINMVPGINISKYRSTLEKCGQIGGGNYKAYYGRCVYVVTNSTVVATSPEEVVTPVVAPPAGTGEITYPETKCSDYGYKELPATAKGFLKSYCNDLNGNDYQNEGSNICSTRSKTCASSNFCASVGCLRCVKQRVDPANCNIKEFACLKDETKSSINIAVSKLKAALSMAASESKRVTAVDSARKQLSNYYKRASTTSFDSGSANPNQGGCVLPGALTLPSKVLGSNGPRSCANAQVNQDFCYCATWPVGSAVEAECRNVITWVSSGKYTQQ